MIALPFPVPWLILGAIVGGSYFAGYRSASNAAEEEAERVAVEAERARWRLLAAMQKETDDISAKYQETIANAEKELADLRRDIKSGAVRLRIKTSSCVPANPSAPGGANGPGTADIDAGTADALTGITGKGDAAIRRLTALQEWVRGVCLGGKQTR